MDKKRIKIGILGCSDIAKRKFIPAVKNSRHAVLSGIASRSEEKAKCWSKDLEVKAHTYEGLLDSQEIDMVYISLPNSLHKQWCIRALDKEKHVLCEKPLSTDLSSVKEIIKAAKRNKKYLFEGLMHLHHPQHSEVKKVLKEGAIGGFRIFRTSFGFNLRDADNFRFKRELGGGAFLDIIGYPVSMLRFLFDCEPVKCGGFQKRDKKGLDISGTASVIMQNGIMAQISYGFDQSYECFYEIIGTKGSIFLDRCYTTPETMENAIRIKVENSEREIQVGQADHFSLMVDDFCRKVIDMESREDIYSSILRQAEAKELVKKGLVDSDK